MTLTATAAPAANGRPPRRQLSDQLDRMDTIIDALAEALPEAVADATREGARQAVREVLVELMTNPDLRAVMAGAAPPVAPTPPRPATAGLPATPGVWARLKARLAAARAAVVSRWQAAAATVRTLTATVQVVAGVMPARQFLAVGAGVGVGIGLLAYACPHAVAAAAAGAGGACAAVAAQAGRWLLRSAAAFGLSGPG